MTIENLFLLLMLGYLYLFLSVAPVPPRMPIWLSQGLYFLLTLGILGVLVVQLGRDLGLKPLW